MNYSYSYQIPFEDMMEGFTAVGSVNSGISSLLGLAAYIFTALALYTIADRRGIRKAWLAWIPIVNVWILGSISDQFRYVVKGQNKSKRKVLLILGIISAVLTAVIVIMGVSLVVSVIFAAVQNANPERALQGLVGSALGLGGVALVLLGIAIAEMVVHYMALYDVYTSCDPKNNVLYLVLSIIPMVSTIAQPLLLFLCREKDEGMPPRLDQPVYDAPPSNWYEEAQQAKEEWNREKAYPAEPWENPEK